jgi:hypothetical protein
VARRTSRHPSGPRCPAGIWSRSVVQTN